MAGTVLKADGLPSSNKVHIEENGVFCSSAESVRLHDKDQDSLHTPRTTLNGVVRPSNIQDEYNKY